MSQLSSTDLNLVLGRLTYGSTLESRRQLAEQGLDAWLSSQLKIQPETHELLSGRPVFLAERLNLRETIEHLVYRKRTEKVSQEVAGQTVLRRVYSVNQVAESLVEFLSDYVPVPLYGSAEWARMDYDREIRRGIFGTYPELLAKLSIHPAMLFYLNGQTNTAAKPNENFGRELLELFTITPAAGYSENDVQAAAKLLSGITFSMLSYQTSAIPDRHHFGPISIQGFRHSNSQTQKPEVIMSRARQMIVHLAKLPATASAFSLRMARRFLSDNPPKDVLASMEKAYLSSQGSIPKTLRAMVLHPKFLSTPPTKVKRPVEHFASTVRALGLEPASSLIQLSKDGVLESDALNPWLSVLNRQGHLPFDWETPDGYPDTGVAWTTFGGQIQRWNFSARAAQGGLTNIFRAGLILERHIGYGDIPALVANLSDELLPAPLRAEDQQRIAALVQANESKSLADKARRLRVIAVAIALLMATEEWNSR